MGRGGAVLTPENTMTMICWVQVEVGIVTGFVKHRNSGSSSSDSTWEESGGTHRVIGDPLQCQLQQAGQNLSGHCSCIFLLYARLLAAVVSVLIRKSHRQFCPRNLAFFFVQA